MKRFFKWLLIFLATFALCELIAGRGLRTYLENYSLPGDYRMSDHYLLNSNEDIIVIGSSVGLNSINTRQIADSTGLSTYNAGANGQSFPYYLTVLKAVTANRSPRKIILALAPDNLSSTGKGIRYNFLIPYYGRGIADVDSVIGAEEPLGGLFLKSNFYRLNRIWFRILLYHFATAGIEGSNGFVAKPVPAIFPSEAGEEIYPPISPEREKQLREFMRICRDKNIDLTMVFTPRRCVPLSSEGDVLESARKISDEFGAAFFDDTNLPPFNSDSTLFYDTGHINIRGASIYTDTIIERIR